LLYSVDVLAEVGAALPLTPSARPG
jgi:hypothetical protein